MQHGEELEVTVRTSARELAIYVVFLSVLVIGTPIHFTPKQFFGKKNHCIKIYSLYNFSDMVC